MTENLQVLKTRKEKAKSVIRNLAFAFYFALFTCLLLKLFYELILSNDWNIEFMGFLVL